jgi:hypothetical protein
MAFAVQPASTIDVVAEGAQEPPLATEAESLKSLHPVFGKGVHDVWIVTGLAPPQAWPHVPLLQRVRTGSEQPLPAGLSQPQAQLAGGALGWAYPPYFCIGYAP